MPLSSFPGPDNFPSRSNSGELTNGFDPLTPLVRSQQANWQEGDRVLAPWEPDMLYAGKIAQIEGVQILVDYDDGSAGWVLLDQLAPLKIVPGQRVQCRGKIGFSYSSAEVLEVRGDQTCVAFADGQIQDWTTLAALRIPCESRGPAAVVPAEATRLAFLANLKIGDEVWAPWGDGTLYAGAVDNIRDREVHVQFFDGDKAWILREQVVPLEIDENQRVAARRRFSLKYSQGTVIERQEEKVRIHFDDGKKEWINISELAIPGQATGPEVQPTNTGNASSAWGWVVPLAVGILLAILRISCR